MLKDGYAAVSSRSVATAVGIQAPLVHYYFPTIDDLFVAVLQRRAGPQRQRMAEALASRAASSVVEARVRPTGHVPVRRAAGGANHRPALKAEVGRSLARSPHADGCARHACSASTASTPSVFPPPLVAAAVQGLAFSAVQDQAAGYDTAAGDAIAAMDAVDRSNPAAADEAPFAIHRSTQTGGAFGRTCSRQKLAVGGVEEHVRTAVLGGAHGEAGPETDSASVANGLQAVDRRSRCDLLGTSPSGDGARRRSRRP